MQGGGVRKGPREVLRTSPSRDRSLGQGRPSVPQIISQMTTPLTRLLRLIISALSRVWIPDQAFRRGSAPELVQRLQVMNSLASVGRSNLFVFSPSRHPFKSMTARPPLLSWT